MWSQGSCGEPQTMAHVVNGCSLTNLDGGIATLHSADVVTVTWFGSQMQMIEEEVYN